MQFHVCVGIAFHLHPKSLVMWRWVGIDEETPALYRVRKTLQTNAGQSLERSSLRSQNDFLETLTL
jgi:hypothetical protein